MGQIINLGGRARLYNGQRNARLRCFLGRLLRCIAGANRKMTETKDHWRALCDICTWYLLGHQADQTKPGQTTNTDAENPAIQV